MPWSTRLSRCPCMRQDTAASGANHVRRFPSRALTPVPAGGAEPNWNAAFTHFLNHTNNCSHDLGDTLALNDSCMNKLHRTEIHADRPESKPAALATFF